MIKKLLMISTMALSLMFSSSIFAHDDAKCMCKHGEMKNFYTSLELTPEQQEHIKKIKEQVKTNMQENRKAMHEINVKLKELVRSEKMDAAMLDKLISQKTALISEKVKNKIMLKNQIYNSLTPEQKSKFAQMMDNMKRKHEAMHKDDNDIDVD